MTDLIAKADTLAKYDSIWSQISRHFKDKSDRLMFEILNEPQTMSKASVDLFNEKVLSIIRKTNPTRIVLYSGTSYTGTNHLIDAKIPDPNDKYLIGYFHSYDPWSFAGEAKGTFGTNSDISSANVKFEQIANWSAKTNIPVILGECGTVKQCDYNSRMIYYSTLVEQAINSKVAFCVWDDNGNFQTYLRSTRKWNDLKDVIIYTYKESPTQLKSTVIDTNVVIIWQNRTSLNDSINIDRRTATSEFKPIAKISPTASRFYDSSLNKNTVYYYRLRTRLLDSIDLYSYPIAVKIIGVRKPYTRTPAQIPGLIEAENYDIGGEGQTFHDSNTANNGNAYRLNEGVDIEERPDNGYQIGYVANGEWTQYSIHVNQPGYYRIDTYTGSINGGGKYSFTIGTTSTTSVNVPQTGDSTILAASSLYKIFLDTGNFIITFKVVTGTTNPFTIDRFVFEKDSSTEVISKKKISSYFEVFPNPAISNIIVRSEELKFPAILDIYNVLGLRIQSEMLTMHETEVSLKSKSKGMYILVLTFHDRKEAKCLVVE
jgi:hypothetical protein